VERETPPVKLSDLFAEQREKHVFSQARPHLDLDEEVVHWARVHRPEGRQHGFVYLTTRRFLLVWGGHGDGLGSISWTDVDAWGVDPLARGGPLLAVGSADRDIFVHMPVRSSSGAARVSSFLRKLAGLAPHPRRRVHRPGHPRGFESDPARMEINRAKLSAGEMTKRVVVTLIGVLLVFTGAVITPIPGPWSFPLLLGGLAVLASEYDWARDVLEWVKQKSRSAKEKLKARRAAR
jgi:hypothetical protein